MAGGRGQRGLNPGAYGGDPAEAFDVIAPPVPGFGFSAPLPNNPDMNSSPPTTMAATFIPWEIPDQWVDDLRRTFRGRR